VSITARELLMPRLEILTSRLGWWSQHLSLGRWASRSQGFSSLTSLLSTINYKKYSLKTLSVSKQTTESEAQH